MLHRELRARERILLIGPWGAGKSNAWCTLAAWYRRTKSPAKVYVVDTDHAADRLAEKYGEEFWENVVAENCWEYDEVLAALKDFRKKATRDDVLVVDLIDKLWGWSQDYYIEQAFGTNAASFFVEFKRDSDKEGNALSAEAGYGANWQVINRLYGDLMTEIQRFPGHVIACSPAEDVQQPNKQGTGGDSKEIRDQYGRAGKKPAGQKALGFQFFSVLLLTPFKPGEWRWQGLKDLNRGLHTGVMKDFVMDYLVPHGGWTL